MSESFTEFYKKNSVLFEEIISKAIEQDEALVEGNLLYLLNEGELDQADVEALRSSTSSIKKFLESVLSVDALSQKLPSAAAWYKAQGRNIQAAEKFVMKLDMNKPKGAKDWVKSIFGKGFTVANGVAVVALIDSMAAGGLNALSEATALIQRNLEGKLEDDVKLVDVPEATGLTKEDIAAGIKKAFDKSMGNDQIKDAQGLMKTIGGKAAKMPGVELSKFPLDSVMPELMELTLPELAELVEALSNVPTPDDGAIDDATSNANSKDGEAPDEQLSDDQIGKAAQSWIDQLKNDGADESLLKIGRQWMSAVSKDPDFKKLAGLSESYSPSLSFLLVEQVKWPDLVALFTKHSPDAFKDFGPEVIEPLVAPFAKGLVDQGVEVVDKSGNPFKPPVGQTDDAIENIEEETPDPNEEETAEDAEAGTKISRKVVIDKANKLAGKAGALVVNKILDSESFKSLNVNLEESLSNLTLDFLVEAPISAEDFQGHINAAMEEDEEAFKDVDTRKLSRIINKVFAAHEIDLDIEEAAPKWDDLSDKEKRRSKVAFYLDGERIFGGSPSPETAQMVLRTMFDDGLESEDAQDLQIDFGGNWSDKPKEAPFVKDIPDFVTLINNAVEEDLDKYGKFKIGEEAPGEEEAPVAVGKIFNYTNSKGKEIFIKVVEENPKEGLWQAVMVAKDGKSWQKDTQSFAAKEDSFGEEASEEDAFDAGAGAPEKQIKTADFNSKIAKAIDNFYGDDEELLDLIGDNEYDVKIPGILAKVSKELFSGDFSLEESLKRRHLLPFLFEGDYKWPDVTAIIDKHAEDVPANLLYAIFAQAIPDFKELDVSVGGVPTIDPEEVKTALAGEIEVDPNAELDIEDPEGVTPEEEKKLDAEADKLKGELGKVPIDKNKLAAILKKYPDIVGQGQKATRARRKLRKAINMAAGMTVFAENFDYGIFNQQKYVLTESKNSEAIERWKKLAGIKDD